MKCISIYLHIYLYTYTPTYLYVPCAEPASMICFLAVAKGNIVSVDKEKYLASVEVRTTLEYATKCFLHTTHWKRCNEKCVTVNTYIEWIEPCNGVRSEQQIREYINNLSAAVCIMLQWFLQLLPIKSLHTCNTHWSQQQSLILVASFSYSKRLTVGVVERMPFLILIGIALRNLIRYWLFASSSYCVACSCCSTPHLYSRFRQIHNPTVTTILFLSSCLWHKREHWRHIKHWWLTSDIERYVLLLWIL